MKLSGETIGMMVAFVGLVIGFVAAVMAVQEAQEEESEYMVVEDFENWGYDREVSGE